MENATKALLMAGGILISILVISIGVYLFASYGELSSSYAQTRETTEIQKFNSNFIQFDGRKDITIHEITTLVNFVKQYKEETGIDVKIYLVNNELKDDDSITLIKEHSDKYFKCNVNSSTDIEYDNYGKVNSIIFRNT